MSNPVRLRLNSARFTAALGKFAQFSKKDAATLLRDQARNFIRRVVDITPPATGKADASARKHGEAAVRADLRRIFTPKDRGFLQYIEKLGHDSGQLKFNAEHGGSVGEWHLHRKDGTPYVIAYDVILWSRDGLVGFHEKRRTANGRVSTASRHVTTGTRTKDARNLDRAFVPKDNFAWFERRVLARVGLLAGGWNKAAQELGTRLPAWVRRHGTGRGDIELQLTGTRLRILVTNDVSYAAAVRDYQPRVQRALNDQAKAMNRQSAFLAKKAARRAGF